MFPQNCACGHIRLYDIQRALLHNSNRGRDGASEDIESEGLSPHKVFLIARRRQAEAQLPTDTGGATQLRESTLVRTRTEMQQLQGFRSSTLVRNQTAASSATKSALRPLLADRLDELEQLKDELRQSPADTNVATAKLRTCAQCNGQFASFEGGQCLFMRHGHFMCNVCFGGYLMKACAPGGVFEQPLANKDGMLVSPPGKLPCPFFEGLPEGMLGDAVGNSLSGSRTSNPLADDERPAMDCHCGAIEM